MTADLSHVVYSPELAYGGRWPFDVTSPSVYSLYEYVGTGASQPALVGVSGGAGSTDLIGVCGTELGSGGRIGMTSSALSADGGTVYFSVAACPAGGSGVNAGVPVLAQELYARIGGSRTVKISERSSSDCTGVCQSSPPGDASFWDASADGSKVFFTSTQQLTNNASEDSHSSDSGISCTTTAGVNGCNLYEYDFTAAAGHNLVDVSAGDSSGGGPRVQKVVGISEDGSHVYFTALGILSTASNGVGQVARAGAENLYVFERDADHPEGRVSFIATLLPNDEDVANPKAARSNVTPDGRFLVFTSHARLTPDDTSTTGAQQVFRYDALTGALTRISIGAGGFNDNGNAGTADAAIVLPAYHEGRAGQPRRDPTMSHDGAFVFFMSPVGLTPRALNEVQIGVTAERGEPEYAENVYEWHEGQVHLISDGRDASRDRSTVCGELPTSSSVCLIGSDATGANVFFTTADSLVGSGEETGVDIYDARICTSGDPCITSPPPPPPPCVGEACHGTPAGSPVFGAPASATFSGAGDLAAPSVPVVKAKKTKKAKPKKKAKPRHKKRKARRAARTDKHVKRGGK
jgi:hypothetical protein